MPFNLQKTAHQKNFELKKKYRNIATRERRKALTAYWYKKTEEIKSKPHDFFDTFRPFLNNKTKDANPIFLKNKDEEGFISRATDYRFTLEFHRKSQSRAMGNTADT